MVHGTCVLTNASLNGWFFRVKLVKGNNSGQYKIINDEYELHDVVYPKPQSAFK